jgi:hypothetical protein
MKLLLLVLVLFVTNPAGSFCQTNVLIASYKPSKAKEGKNGDQRFGIRLFRMAKSGKDAKDGEKGVDLKIKVTAVQQDDSTLLKLFCFVNNTLRDSFFINPANTQIKFLAVGGDGGTGGSGETGLPPDGKKDATSGGDGAKGGKGGKGGFIEVYFDSTAIAFAQCKCIVYSNDGGEGGDGGNGGYAGSGYSSKPQAGKGNEGVHGAHGEIGPPVLIKSLETNKVIFIKNIY